MLGCCCAAEEISPWRSTEHSSGHSCTRYRLPIRDLPISATSTARGIPTRAPSRAGYALLTKSKYCRRGCIGNPKALDVAPFELRCCAERFHADHCHVPLSPLAPAYSLPTGSARKLRRFAKALQRLCSASLSQLVRPTRGPDTSDILQLVLMKRLAHAVRHVSQESITYTDPRSEFRLSNDTMYLFHARSEYE
jgi:hypothetical protein